MGAPSVLTTETVSAVNISEEEEPPPARLAPAALDGGPVRVRYGHVRGVLPVGLLAWGF